MKTTDEQWQWVLEQCGFHEAWWEGSRSMRDYYPDGTPLETDVSGNPLYPRPDLNNLFKYAVPKIREKGILFLVNVLIEWLMDYIYRDKDPASALLGACFKAFGGKK